MIVKDVKEITLLNKLNLSTKEIILYLESINTANSQILSVLKRKPALPGYDKLPWVVNIRVDMTITSKLKNNNKLSVDEKDRLKEILAVAVKSLKKMQGVKTTTSGLDMYIQTLS